MRHSKENVPNVACLRKTSDSETCHRSRSIRAEVEQIAISMSMRKGLRKIVQCNGSQF